MTSARRLIEAIKTEITPARSPSPTSYMQLIEIFPLQSITSVSSRLKPTVIELQSNFPSILPLHQYG